MILYQKELRSKELTQYVDFLKKIKTLGGDFLVKGDMWIPSIKTVPGIHIGKDPMLSNYHSQTNSTYTKYTCTHLEELLSELSLKGKKHYILFELTDTEISLYINDTQWVIASKYIKDTTDFYPRYNYFSDILSEFQNWYPLNDDILQALIDGHPVTLKGIIPETGEVTHIRLAKKNMKLRGDQCRKLDHTGEYALSNHTDSSFDDTVCKLIIHMNYQKIECVNIYHMRKYTRKDNQAQ